jgi:hypothetical protein
MGWFDDYDRNYRNDRDWGRGGNRPAYGSMGAANGLGYWNTPYGYWGGGYDAGYRGRGTTGYGADYGYDRMLPASSRRRARPTAAAATARCSAGRRATATTPATPSSRTSRGGMSGGRVRPAGFPGRADSAATATRGMRSRAACRARGADRQQTERFGARGGNRGFQGGRNEGRGANRNRGDWGYGW